MSLLLVFWIWARQGLQTSADPNPPPPVLVSSLQNPAPAGGVAPFKGEEPFI